MIGGAIVLLRCLNIISITLKVGPLLRLCWPFGRSKVRRRHQCLTKLLSKVPDCGQGIVPAKQSFPCAKPRPDERPETSLTRISALSPRVEIVCEKEAPTSVVVPVDRSHWQFESIAIGHLTEVNPAIGGKAHIPPGASVHLK